MDFPCDDPAGKGTVSEQLERLRKDLKKRLATKSKNMRNAFRKMATDGKIDGTSSRAGMRNLDVGVGQPKLVERLFHEIDDDNSGHLTFAEFSAGVEHPRDATMTLRLSVTYHEIIWKKRRLEVHSWVETRRDISPNTPDEDNSSDVARPETDQNSETNLL